MRAMFALPLVLLVAAVNGEVFKFVHQQGASTVYGVRGAVTVGAHKLTGEKTALEYNGTLAIEQGREGEYLAKFTRFTLGKYDKINRNVEDQDFELEPEEQRLVKALREQGLYETEMKKPVRFFMKQGKVDRMEAEKEHRQWSLNIYRAVFTLLQNQAQKPGNLEIPHIEYNYEDGIAGNCKVQYEILSQPEDGTVPEVYNITKTKNFKDCMGPLPVYLHLKDSQRGCAGVCDGHRPENFLGQYEEEKTDYEMKPTPGCPVNRQRHDTLVTLHKISKYNVTKGLLDEAQTDSMDVYRLFGGEMQVRTRLELNLYTTQGPKVEEPKNVVTYNTLKLRLPKEEQELDIPIYALMTVHGKTQEYTQYFKKHFEAAIRELTQLKEQKKGQQPLNTPAYLLELVQAMSAMTEEQIKQTMPEGARHQQPRNLNEQQHLERQFWIEILGKAGSKTAVKVGAQLIKTNVFNPTETRRFLQDVAGFQSYPDTEMIEEILNLCTGEGKLTSTGKATACVAAGKIISKACDSQVSQWGHKEQQQLKQHYAGRYSDETPAEQQGYGQTMGSLSIKPELRCTTEKLHKYIERLTRALQGATEFKQVVAYINGLAKIEKPEVLPELIGYVNGTAPNMYRLNDQKHGEEQKEAVEFVRRVAILSLRSIASKYPKEVNPIVRVIYLNTTEEVQTRLIAFDVWMNTQPAQWEVEKVMQVANKDTSLELTHYVYTALKTAMHAEEPCYQLLAKRIRDAWTQIRPFDLGMEFSHLRSRSYYDNLKDYGVRGIWKMIASNTTILPTFTQAKFEQVRGPYMKTFFGAKFLVKGGDKIWEEIVGKDGLLERIAHAVDGQVKNGEQKREAEQLLKDIAKEMNINTREGETPKGVLYWQLFSGEAIIPIDHQYYNEFKQELLQTVTKFGKEGVSGHFVRVFLPTKAFHVGPSSIGLPIVHSTIHPIVFSVRYENLKLRYDNQQNRVVPEKFELTGTIQPTILSIRQSRIFVAEKEGQTTPTMKVSNIKEFNFRTTFRVVFDHPEQRLKINIKPHFDRVYHSGHCTELNLEENSIIDAEPRLDAVEYNKCIKSMTRPIRREQQLGGQRFGMNLKVTGESHEPFAGLPVMGSKDVRQHGLIAALLNRVSNKGMKHQTVSLFLEPSQEKPVNEWDIVIDMDSNVEKLAKIPVAQQAEKVQKVKIQYQPRHDEKLSSEFQQVIRKVEQALEKQLEQSQDLNDETTMEKQILIKIEGRYQDKPQHTIKAAMKKIFNLEKTEQKYAVAIQSEQSSQFIELYGQISYPEIASPFHYDPTFAGKDERMNGTFVARIQGQQEEIYRINFNATKSQEQSEESELDWFEVRCLAEQKAGKTMTDACKKAILKQNSLDRMEMEIQLPQNIHPKMKQAARQLLTLIKYKFYSQMRSEISGRQQEQLKRGEEKKIHISAEASRLSPWAILYNVRMEMPRENVTLSNVRLPGFRPAHMILTGKQQLEHVLFRGQKDNYCVLGEKGVRTYDNVTFGLDVKPECEYVLTRDCQGTPDFTVTFSVVKPETFAKKIRIQLVNSIIELHPFTTVDRYVTVYVNGTKHTVTFEKPIVFEYAGGKRVFIHAHGTAHQHNTPIVHVYTESKEFHLAFDGYTAQTFVDNKYKGVTCGVCGNNDNEQAHEFIGPQGREYQQANEFIASYGIGQGCREPVRNTHQEMMEMLQKELREQIRRQQLRRKEQQGKSQSRQQGNEWYWEGSELEWTEEDHVEEDRYVQKTAVSSEQDLICFSVEPVPTCKQGYKNEGVSKTIRVEAVCLEKNERAAAAMKAVRSQRVIDISALEPYKQARMATMVNIPKCVRDL